MISFANCQFVLAQEPAAPPRPAARTAAGSALLDGPLESPSDQLRAVLTLLNLGETDVAAHLFNEFRQRELSDEERFALVQQFGTARFLALARMGEAPVDADDEPLLPGAAEFVTTCLEAAERVATQPDRLRSLVQDLTSDNPAVRKAARVDLASAGMAAVQMTFESLARSDDADARAQLLHALADMRPLVHPLLVAAVADGRGEFRRDAVELAGHLRTLDAIAWVAAFAAGANSEPRVVGAAQVALEKMGFTQPDLEAARDAVRRELNRVAAGIHAVENGDGMISWWSYDPEQQAFSHREVTQAEYQRLATARLTRIFVDLPDATPAERQQALVAAEQVAHESGIELAAEYEELAESLSVNELNAALGESLRNQYTGAARVLARRLGERGDAAALVSLGSHPSPLARALAHSDRDLRFTALEAVMRIQPATPFPGSSQVGPALWHFAAGAGSLQALAAAPVSSRASDWAGHLRELGYDAISIYSGRELLRQAASAPRLSMVLVDSDLANPGFREIVFQLRSNQPTATIPITVFCSSHNLDNCRHLAESDSQLLTVPRPHDQASLAAAVERLLDAAGSEDSPENRTRQAEQALRWLTDLFQQDHPYNELLRGANTLGATLYNPDLTEVSIEALAKVGTARSQQLLLDFINLDSQPMELRQVAADAFQQSFTEFGNHLTGSELSRQYDRYNASSGANRETQELLGRVLDVLEYREPPVNAN